MGHRPPLGHRSPMYVYMHMYMLLTLTGRRKIAGLHMYVCMHMYMSLTLTGRRKIAGLLLLALIDARLLLALMDEVTDEVMDGVMDEVTDEVMDEVMDEVTDGVTDGVTSARSRPMAPSQRRASAASAVWRSSSRSDGRQTPISLGSTRESSSEHPEDNLIVAPIAHCEGSWSAGVDASQVGFEAPSGAACEATSMVMGRARLNSRCTSFASSSRTNTPSTAISVAPFWTPCESATEPG